MGKKLNQLNNSNVADLKVVKKEKSASSHINITSHVDEYTLIDKNSQLIRIFKIKGINATKLDDEQRAIEKEMRNVMPAFRFLDESERVPIGYKWIPCHMVFDVKMDFTRKARFVAGGHVTDPPTTLTYASVVSRESVRIAFLIAALNNLDILANDVGNAYLNADT